MGRQLPLPTMGPGERAFVEFHEANPHVYQKLCELARQAKKMGRHRLGMKALWERLRWFSQFEVETVADWRLNNSHTAYYARLIMASEPDLIGIFRTRGRR